MFIIHRLLADAARGRLRELGMRKLIFIALMLAGSSVAFANSGALFTGGRGSGAAHAEFILQPQVSQAFHFLGGAFDGYASVKFFSTWWQNPPRRFLGGSYDGYDSRAVFGIPNWTLGDSVGDGIPDWWRAQYFGGGGNTTNVLSCASCDPDHDGISNLAEYLAGTNPTNADSFFHIAALTFGSPTKIFVTCEPGKFYTLLSADNIATNWTAVTNQTRIPSTNEGTLELDDSFQTNRRFYRVRLEQ